MIRPLANHTIGVRLAAVTAMLVVTVGTAMLALSYILLVQWLPDSIVLQGPTGEVAVPLAGPLPQDSEVQLLPEGAVLPASSCELAVLTIDPASTDPEANWLPEFILAELWAGRVGIVTVAPVPSGSDVPWLTEATAPLSQAGEMMAATERPLSGGEGIQWLLDAYALQAPFGETAAVVYGREEPRFLDSIIEPRADGGFDGPLARPLDGPHDHQLLHGVVLVGPAGDPALVTALPTDASKDRWRPDSIVAAGPSGEDTVLTALPVPGGSELQRLPDGTALLSPACEVRSRVASPLSSGWEAAGRPDHELAVSPPLNDRSTPAPVRELPAANGSAPQAATADDTGPGLADAVPAAAAEEVHRAAGHASTGPVADGTAVTSRGVTQQQVDVLLTELVQAAARGYRTTIMRRFVAQSAVVLTLLTIAAVAVGWVGSRRMLRPVHAMSATAQRLGAGSLNERIQVAGPKDELRDLAETFNAMLDRVEEAFGRERRFMANVSHELRTPLANQHIALELALEDPDASADDLRRVAGTALEQNVRAKHLIEELLILARADQGMADPPTSSCDLADAARHAIDAVRLLPDTAGTIDLSADLAPALVRGHPALIERLVGNLIENAVRHNHPGGFVRITTTEVDGTGRIEVENSGPIVPTGTVAGLFEPFRRGPTGQGDRVRSDRGAGLGLSVVAAVVQRYGARLQATARPEGGLRVSVKLNARDRHPEALAPGLRQRIPS